MPLGEQIDLWGRDTEQEEDTIDDPDVAAHQLKTHIFLLIIRSVQKELVFASLKIAF